MWFCVLVQSLESVAWKQLCSDKKKRVIFLIYFDPSKAFEFHMGTMPNINQIHNANSHGKAFILKIFLIAISPFYIIIW